MASPNFTTLLQEAVNKPGTIMTAYSAFHSYSLGNQLLALVQCQLRGIEPGPINTFPKWQDLGRHVKKGEKALTLCVPVTIKRKETSDTGEEQDASFTTFVYKARWFVLSQTEGEAMQSPPMPTWDADRALSALDIQRVAFTETDGNCQGYARLCCRQHKRAYVAKSVMWRRVIPPRKYVVPSICTPHKFSSL